MFPNFFDFFDFLDFRLSSDSQKRLSSDFRLFRLWQLWRLSRLFRLSRLCDGRGDSLTASGSLSLPRRDPSGCATCAAAIRSTSAGDLSGRPVVVLSVDIAHNSVIFAYTRYFTRSGIRVYQTAIRAYNQKFAPPVKRRGIIGNKKADHMVGFLLCVRSPARDRVNCGVFFRGNGNAVRFPIFRVSSQAARRIS